MGAVSGFASGLSTGLNTARKRRKDEEPDRTDHQNKSYMFADGGKVPKEGTTSGMVPKFLHRAWGAIPSVADLAVTGKISATPEEYDEAKRRKEDEIARKSKPAK